MPRLAFLGSATLIVAACAALPACGQQDETQKIIAQCSEPAPEALDSCLEQVRVQQETDPSPELDKLLAKLTGRQVEARNPPQEAPSSPPPDENPVSSDAVPPPSPDLNDGGGDQSPAMSPDDEAPPVQQGNPADVGSDEANGPPAQMPGPDDGPGSTPNPPDDGGPGGSTT